MAMLCDLALRELQKQSNTYIQIQFWTNFSEVLVLLVLLKLYFFPIPECLREG